MQLADFFASTFAPGLWNLILGHVFLLGLG
jgi:hypothetical protein